MKSGLPYLFLVFFHFTVTFSQDPPTGYEVQPIIPDFLQGNSSPVRAFASGYEGVRGTPYIFEDFRSGNFYMNNKTSILNMLINYDCYQDHVMYSDRDNTYIMDEQKIEYFTIAGDEPEGILLFKQVFLPSEKKIVFLQVIYNEKSIVYKRHLKDFIKADYTGPYNPGRRYDEYTDNQAYYIKLPHKEIRQIKSGQKFIKETFGDQSALIKDFIKEEKINLKDEYDLVKMATFYDHSSGDEPVEQ
jgi:hypothetical protein